MKAILMAAGIGSRINHKINKPKSLLDVGNVSILRHTAEMLLTHGIEVGVVVGYRKQELIDALEGLNVKFFYNPFFKVTNSMASLWFAQEFIPENEDLILANADVFWCEDILNELLRLPDTIMLADSSRAQVGDYLFKTENGRIIKYGKELPMEERSCEYVGIAKISSSTVQVFRDRLNVLVEKDMYNLWWENVLYEYSKIDPVFVEDINGLFWAEVDYIEDYLRILDFLRNKK